MKTMANTPGIDDEIRQAVQRFLETIGRRYDVAGAIVFGSRARGDHRPDSDTDLAVLLRGAPGGVVREAVAMADDAADVLVDTGVNINALPLWATQWEHPERYSNPTLLASIAREGIWF